MGARDRPSSETSRIMSNQCYSKFSIEVRYKRSILKSLETRLNHKLRSYGYLSNNADQL